MRNLKKRILSFVSAVAMVATLLPTTGIFASALEVGESIVLRSTNEEWSNWNDYDVESDVSFNVETAGTYELSATGWRQDGSWLKLEVDGTTYYNADGSSDGYKTDFTKTYPGIKLTEGSHSLHYLVKQGKWYDVKLTLTESDAPAKEPVDLSGLGVTISAMSNDRTKGTVSATAGETSNVTNDTKLTYEATGDNNFVGWYLRASDDNTSGLLLNKKTELDVNAVSGYIAEYAAEHSDKNLTIFATFAGWRNYRYEAEDYVSLVSETQYKYLNTEEEHDKYDDPTVVLEGNKGYTQGETATHTVYDADGKFSDGHYAKADGAGYEDVEATITPQFDASWDNYNSVNKYKFNGWSDHKIVVSVPAGLNNPRVSIKFYANCNVKVYADGNQIYGGENGENPNGDKVLTYNVESGKDSLIILQADPNGRADVGIENQIGDNIKVQSEKQGTGDKVKYQHYYGDGDTFDKKSYSDMKIAPNYSNGQAVALTGPSNGIAIPFSLTEATTTDMTVELGYNLGTMPKSYDNGSTDTPVWVNIYYLGSAENGLNDYSQFESAITSNGARWQKSGNAYYDRAKGALQVMMPTNVDNLHEYTSYYFGVTEDGDDTATYIDGSKVPQGVDTRSSDRSITLKLPHGLPAGSYAISIATDQRNCDSDGEALPDDVGEMHKVGNENNYHAGTAYYDYVQFRMIDDPSKPNAFVSGADISFTDSGVGNDGEDSKMKNTLRVTEFSDISFDENGLKFTPVAPEFLVNQGYEFTGWTLKVNNDPGKGTSNELTLDKILGSADKTNYSETCAAISSYAFPAGTSIEFIANYKIENGSQTLTVENGTIYIPEGGRKNNEDGTEETENYTIAAKDKNVTLRRFANVKLVADEKEGETFSHWTVNGMIYSYNKEIFFSSVYNATFVANYDNDVTKPEATAYIDKNVALSGFSDADNTNQQKITFLAEYSINDGSYNIKDKFDNAEFGLIYAATDEGLANMKSAKNSSTFSGSIARCGKMVVTNKENIIRNETFFGIGGLRLGRTYYAMSYVVYNGNVYYSDIVSIAPTAADNNVVKTATIVE